MGRYASSKRSTRLGPLAVLAAGKKMRSRISHAAGGPSSVPSRVALCHSSRAASVSSLPVSISNTTWPHVTTSRGTTKPDEPGASRGLASFLASAYAGCAKSGISNSLTRQTTLPPAPWESSMMFPAWM